MEPKLRLIPTPATVPRPHGVVVVKRETLYQPVSGESPPGANLQLGSRLLRLEAHMQFSPHIDDSFYESRSRSSFTTVTHNALEDNP
uniref:Uncharacterized protein n=1 Tax=Oryza glumipatula TaxID=40148 RepID=A0A0D9YH61_9ORYZ